MSERKFQMGDIVEVNISPSEGMCKPKWEKGDWFVVTDISDYLYDGEFIYTCGGVIKEKNMEVGFTECALIKRWED